MIGASHAERRQQLARKRAKTALHPVSDDSAANFLRHGDADAPKLVAVRPVMDQQDEAGHGLPLAFVGGKKIGPFRDGRDRAGFPAVIAQADRLLRPRARRARRMLRPPTVA
jgi:hypothetical protein